MVTSYGTSALDVIFGSNFDDRLSGLSGDDRLYGNSGADTLYGGSGEDRLFSGVNGRRAVGEEGDDYLYVFGSSGSDSVKAYGGSGSDFVFVDGGSALDPARAYGQGDSGNDTVTSRGSSSALLFGDLGDDTISGGLLLFGGAGNDSLFGQSGDDFLSAGSGTDALFGGRGRDTFLVQSGQVALYGGSGPDKVSLELSGLAADQFLDLRTAENRLLDGPGGSTGSRIVSVEAFANFVGGSGSDTVIAGNRSDFDETLFGAEGDDSLDGRGGDNFLYGDEGSDRLESRSGDNSLYGGEGADRLYIQGDSLASDARGDDGDDSIFATGQAAHVLGGGSGNDSLDGGALLFGDDGDDVVRSREGEDRLFGGSGADLLLAGDDSDSLYGGADNDRLVGGSGADTLFGGDGQDRLNGGSGADTAAGGQGNDTFIVDNSGDVILEIAGGGAQDVLRSNAADYSLGGGAMGFTERVNINAAAGDAELRGNDNANTLIGNSFSNVLMGRSGNDRLNSRGGTNTMTGGSGDDTFIVTTAADIVREFAPHGTDLVRAEVDFTLPNGGSDGFVENLRLQGGAGNIEGRGNDLDNTVQGNSGDNALRGVGGDDTVIGGEGDDDIFGGLGADRFEGESGADTLHLASGDIAFGGSGEDSFLFNGAPLGDAGSGGPILRDFDGISANAANGEDKLVFATGLEVGSFAYIGGAAFSGGGNSEARFDGARQIQVDQDGDGNVDQAFLLDGVTAANLLTATDFVWL